MGELSFLPVIMLSTAIPCVAISYREWHMYGLAFVLSCVFLALSLYFTMYNIQKTPRRVRAEEGVSKIIHRMQLNIADESFQIEACDALLAILRPKMRVVVAQEVKEAVEYGILDTLYQVLEAHACSVEVTGHCFTVFVQIFAHACAKEALAGSSLGFAPIVNAMTTLLKAATDCVDSCEEEEEGEENDKKEKETTQRKKRKRDENLDTALLLQVQRTGCLVLGAAVDGHTDSQTLAVDDGAIEAVLDAAQWYQNHAIFCQWACWALFNLSFEHPPNKAYIARKGGIKTVIEALRQHPEEEELNRQGIAVLYSCLNQCDIMADGPMMAKTALEGGAIEVAQTASERFPNNKEIVAMSKGLSKLTF